MEYSSHQVWRERSERVMVTDYYNYDGEVLSQAEAQKEWVSIGREVLIAVARRRDLTISYSDFASVIQNESGVRTTKPLPQWIGGVLDLIGLECASSGEPLLSALCVRRDGSIGQGFARQYEQVYGAGGAFGLEDAAYMEQERCWSFEWVV